MFGASASSLRSRRHDTRGANIAHDPQIVTALEVADRIIGSHRVADFWNFVAEALKGPASSDTICRQFQLGGVLDAIPGVAFVRDEISGEMMRTDMESVVWHILLFCWLGGGGLRHATYNWQRATYNWLRALGLTRTLQKTTDAIVTDICGRVSDRISKFRRRGDLGLEFVAKDRQALLAWRRAAHGIARALVAEVAPAVLESQLLAVPCLGEPIAKEVFLHLSYVAPLCADTSAVVFVAEAAVQGAVLALGELPPGSPIKAVQAVYATQRWALSKVQQFADAALAYSKDALHASDPVRGVRARRQPLLDLTDVEAMLCHYSHYMRLRDASPRLMPSYPDEWELRASQTLLEERPRRRVSKKSAPSGSWLIPSQAKVAIEQETWSPHKGARSALAQLTARKLPQGRASPVQAHDDATQAASAPHPTRSPSKVASGDLPARASLTTTLPKHGTPEELACAAEALRTVDLVAAGGTRRPRYETARSSPKLAPSKGKRTTGAAAGRGAAGARGARLGGAAHPGAQELGTGATVQACGICGGAAQPGKGLGAPLSCATCTDALRKRRRLSFCPGQRVWCRGFGPTWPAQVCQLSFGSPQDACPYWIRFFGESRGAWVSEVKLMPWGQFSRASNRHPNLKRKEWRARYDAALAEADNYVESR